MAVMGSSAVLSDPPIVVAAVANLMLNRCHLSSCSIRECTEYYPRTSHAGTCEPPLHLQFALQLPGYRVHVRNAGFMFRDSWFHLGEDDSVGLI